MLNEITISKLFDKLKFFVFLFLLVHLLLGRQHLKSAPAVFSLASFCNSRSFSLSSLLMSCLMTISLKGSPLFFSLCKFFMTEAFLSSPGKVTSRGRLLASSVPVSLLALLPNLRTWRLSGWYCPSVVCYVNCFISFLS